MLSPQEQNKGNWKACRRYAMPNASLAINPVQAQRNAGLIKWAKPYRSPCQGV